MRVWNFTLPLSPSLKSSFGLRDQDNVAIQEELLKNKLSPAWVDARETQFGTDWTWILEWRELWPLLHGAAAQREYFD